MLIRTINNVYSALPDSTSMGTQEKWVIDNRFYKLDPLNGYDSLAEATVSELESHIKDFSFVDYFIDFPKTVEDRKRRVCYSYNCVPKGYTEVTLYKIIINSVKDLSSLNRYTGKDYMLKCSEIVEKAISFNPIRYFSKVIYLDSITLNEDWHLNNLSFLVDKNGKGSEMPVLDNGRALLSNEEVYGISRDLSVCLRRVKSKPFSTSFKRQVGYFLGDYPPLVIDYEPLLLKLDEVYSSATQYTFGSIISTRMLRRMITVLKLNLSQQEGITWVRK